MKICKICKIEKDLSEFCKKALINIEMNVANVNLNI